MVSSFLNKLLIIIIFFFSLSSSLPSSPTISPFDQISPEIAPLLPSPGGADLPSGSGTIPSSPSPPDPDTSDDSFPDPLAFAPFASPPVSSPAPPPPTRPPVGVLLLSVIVSLRFVTLL
ncbi:hypothetical protein AALP_AA8G393900 [Arabis alpina]|uniref:Classical arabinogalactan protein 25 n=1 Tax=Arabis alpina TaxID=50452 RepID=A0A087GCB8_ARAAL|nr:hypothetical protein AALP_AA8G393900 [Arabis alpina]